MSLGEKPRPSRKQAEFLAYLGREAMYGGAAGGGKSDALLMAALQYVHVPRYSALILRRTFPDLAKPGALIPRSKEWLNGLAKWNEQQKQWVFPSGAVIAFGYLERDDDVYQYQGSEFQSIGVDEASQHTDFRYRYMFSRLRPLVGVNVPIRMRAASNPGGIGHEFLKRRFVVPGAPKHFVPAFLQDNPGIIAKDYIANLNELDPITRAQLLAGDWDAYEGGRFKGHWFRRYWVEIDKGGQPEFVVDDRDGHERAVIGSAPTVRRYKACTCWQFITVDPASRVKDVNDYTAIGVFCVTPARDILVLEVVRAKIPLDDIVPRIAKLCQEYEPSFVGIEDSGFQVAILNAARRHPRIPATRPLSPEGKDKLVRATPAIIRTEAGQVYLPEHCKAHPWVEDFIAECVQFTGDPDEDAHDDQVDMFAYAVQCLDRHGLSGGPIQVETEEEEDGRGDRTHGYFGGRR